MSKRISEDHQRILRNMFLHLQLQYHLLGSARMSSPTLDEQVSYVPKCVILGGKLMYEWYYGRILKYNFMCSGSASCDHW